MILDINIHFATDMRDEVDIESEVLCFMHATQRTMKGQRIIVSIDNEDPSDWRCVDCEEK